jgi:FtsP/CotA-like multicopper oxidase with cupredoxin domain
MHGALIVEPPNDEFLDDFLKNIDFKVVMISHLNTYDDGGVSITDLESLGDSTIDTDIEDYSALYNVSNGLYDFRINGLYQPVLHMQQNEWVGFRLYNVGTNYGLFISFDGCETHLVARDGVYLNEALQEDVIVMFPGNRVDVAVRCPNSGIYPVFHVLAQSMDWMCSEEEYIHCLNDEMMLFILDVAESDLETDDFPDYWVCPPRPWYLQDLSDIPYDQLNGTFEIVGGFDQASVTTPAFNDHAYVNETNYMHGISMHPFGIYEFNLTIDPSNTASHPIHFHVNHFQIVGESVRNQDSSYTSLSSGNITSLYRIGEHRDTVMTFANRVLTIRISTFGFTGSLVLHCHYLIHSDAGMIATIAVSDQAWDQGLQNNVEDWEEMPEEQDIGDFEDDY